MAYEKLIEKIRKRVTRKLPPVSREELQHPQYSILWECYASQFVLPMYSLEEKVCYLTHRIDKKSSKPERVAEIMRFVREVYEITGGKRAGTCHAKSRDIDAFLNHAKLAGYDRESGKAISSVLYNKEACTKEIDKREEEEKQRVAEIREAEKAAIEARKAEKEAERQRKQAEKERLSEYIKAVKKQRKRGQSSKETRLRASNEKEEKIHQLYREKHGTDADHISLNERVELYAQIRKENENRRRQEERDRQAKITKAKEEADMVVTHKVRLHLNNTQKTYFQKCFGVARFCYNWAYDQWEAANRRGERVFAKELAAQFNAINKEKYPWTYEVTSCAKSTGFMSFEKAQNSMIDGGAPPKRKRHKLGTGSLYLVITGKRKEPSLLDYNPDIPNSKPSNKRQYLFVQGLGYVKMMERLRYNGVLSSAVIKLESDGQYYAALNVYITKDEWLRKHPKYTERFQEPTGIDLGVHDLAILSNGLVVDKHKSDNHLRDRKRQLQQSVKHKKEAHPGHTSKKQKRLARELAAIKSKMKRQRDDYYHKVASVLANTFENICMEDLNVKSMIRDGQLPPHLILGAALYRFRELMEQKTKAVGHHLHFADKGYPSSNICSHCGHQEPDMPVKQRTFRCTECGAEIDRDINAAINLAKLIGMDEPNLSTAANGVTVALLTRNGISTHQATNGK